MLAVYVKQGVENFIFNGADLMWPGVLGLSSPDFKQNTVAVVFARNQLVRSRIQTAQAGSEE